MARELPRAARETPRQPSCLIVQHVASEGPYVIADVLARAGAEVDQRVLSSGADLPRTLEGYQGLVVMGGPMSATSDEGFSSRAGEVELLEEALARGTPTLGVCLGAQLLAVAAGGKVYPGTMGPEIGWGAVSFTDAAATDPLLSGLGPEATVLHWHADTFDVPPGSTHLASSGRYPNQAFRAGDWAWGFQFHLEVDVQAVRAFLAAFGDDAIGAGTPPETIAAGAASATAKLAGLQRLVLERFAGLVLAASSA
jgi:GMP synthase-like glutamine amidotransferase